MMLLKFISLALLFLAVSCKQIPNLRGKYEAEAAQSGLEFLSGDRVLKNYRDPTYNDSERQYQIYKGNQGDYIIRMFDRWGTSTRKIEIQKDVIILEGDAKIIKYHRVDHFSWE
jgi:hypothetical protein